MRRIRTTRMTTTRTSTRTTTRARPRATTRRSFALAGAVACAACASAGGGTGGPELAGGPVTVEVENRSTYNVVVYALYGGQRLRLGDVTALGDASFDVPPALQRGVLRVRFVLDAIGTTQGHRSEEVTISEGSTVMIRIQPNLRQSTVFVL